VRISLAQSPQANRATGLECRRAGSGFSVEHTHKHMLWPGPWNLSSPAACHVIRAQGTNQLKKCGLSRPARKPFVTIQGTSFPNSHLPVGYVWSFLPFHSLPFTLLFSFSVLAVCPGKLAGWNLFSLSLRQLPFFCVWKAGQRFLITDCCCVKEWPPCVCVCVLYTCMLT